MSWSLHITSLVYRTIALVWFDLPFCVSFLCNLFADNYCCALLIMHHVMLAFTVVSSTF